MKKEVLQLDGPWEFKEFPETARRMRDLDTTGWMTASVPSSIFTCLSDAGVIDSSEFLANPEQFQWVSDRSWIFRKQFDAPTSLCEKERVHLTFEGLDTVTHIWLNGKLLGKTENMFTPHGFDITGRLKPAGNVIHVKFLPALQHAERLMQRYGRLSEHHFGDPRRCCLRKAQYQFGSALGPAMVGCGIFRSVRIEGADIARISNLHVRTVDCDQHKADIRIAVSLNRTQQMKTALHCKIMISGGGLELSETLHFSPYEDHHAIVIQMDRPILWWPRGFGVQHQYRVCIQLFHEQQLLDTSETDFGIRTIRLNRSADKHGHTFQFEVNGQPITIKGANWVPPSILPATQNSDDYALFLKQAADANMNMLRVWGGGLYEHSAFYQQCDQLGILVWQDFMFATAYYPDRKWFSESVQKEARSVIMRLRNHPSLALWCGNSRIDSMHETGRLGAGRKFFGKAIYHSLLPGLLSELDPDRDYIPTTPFSEPGDTGHNDPRSGTTHNWNLRNPVTNDNAGKKSGPDVPRFVAEFGLQSAPDIQTASQIGLRDDVPAGCVSFEKHNYQPGGQAGITRSIAEQFLPANRLKGYTRQSQIVQARAAKYFVEHLRCRPEINAGCLIWTLNDPLPSVNFSAIDAAGRPKALYYYAKRFFAPVLVALRRSEKKGVYSVSVVNDSLRRITATLHCRMINLSGTVLDEMEIPVALSPLQSSNPYSLAKSFSQLQGSRNAFLHLSLISDGGILAENSHFFSPDKHLQYHHAAIDMEVAPHCSKARTWTVRLCGQTPVRDVQLIAPMPARLSDNFFTLLPGCPKDIEIVFEQGVPLTLTPIEIIANTGTLSND